VTTTTAPGQVYPSRTAPPDRSAAEILRRTGFAIGEILITLGLVLLLFALYEVYGKTEIVHAHQNKLDQQLNQAWGAPGAPDPKKQNTQPLPGSAFARLYLPVLHMHWVIVQGVALSDIQWAPGHYPGTAMPGQVGNFSVAGHRIPSIFWNLQELTPGQQIVVQTKDDWYVYTVTAQEAVLPTAIKVIAPVPDTIGAAPTQAMMTLTTCNPKWADYQRLIVHAVLTSKSSAKAGPPVPLGS